MKKNNTAQKNLLQVEKLSKALKEGTERNLNNLIKEALSDLVDDGDDDFEEEQPVDENSYEVEDVETNDETVETDEDVTSDEEGTEGEEADAQDVDAEEAEDEWTDMEDFKVGDNDYDFTNVDDATALKVYNKLGDDDQIFVQKEENGTYTVKDEESGAEFVIELGDEHTEDAEDDEEPVDVDLDVEFDDETPSDDDEEEMDFEVIDDEETADGEEEIELDDEIEINEEDLGYTDSYQKDVMPNLNMNEPANKNATYSMDGGVPTGNQKPWAGKNVDKHYTEVNENQTTSKSQKRKMVKTMAPNSGEEDKPEVTKVTSVAGKQINEAKVRQIVEAAKAIQAENKQYQELIGKIKTCLNEAAILNVNYGKLVNLLVNETTTRDEKRSIVERFKNVTTINEGKILYDTIKRELNENAKKNTASVLQEQVSASSSKTINETTIFTNHPSLNLMERMDNLTSYYKKRK